MFGGRFSVLDADYGNKWRSGWVRAMVRTTPDVRREELISIKATRWCVGCIT